MLTDARAHERLRPGAARLLQLEGMHEDRDDKVSREEARAAIAFWVHDESTGLGETVEARGLVGSFLDEDADVLWARVSHWRGCHTWTGGDPPRALAAG